MRKLLFAALLAPLMALAGPFDISTSQRNATDNGSIPRTVAKPPGTQDGIMGFKGDPVDPRPVHWTVGTGLAIQSGSLVSTVPAGATGPAGPQGAQGIPGVKGDKGNDGIAGAAGQNGAQGVQGLPGATGAQGLPGVAGQKGDKGDTGDAGATGLNGAAAAAGIQGAQGPQGLTGPTGLKGDKGDTGLTGSAGIQGLSGAKGDTGATGPQGITGATGPQGIQGIQGPAGTPAPAPSFSGAATRQLNTAYQVSAARNSNVNYAVDVTVTALLLTGSRGTVTLQYADNSGMTTNLVTLMSGTSSIGGVLNVSAVQTVFLSGWIPAGKFVRITTANTAGTPTFAYSGGNESLF